MIVVVVVVIGDDVVVIVLTLVDGGSVVTIVFLDKLDGMFDGWMIRCQGNLKIRRYAMLYIRCIIQLVFVAKFLLPKRRQIKTE